MTGKPTVPYVLPLCMQVYELPDFDAIDERTGRQYRGSHGCGGCLHVVLDDGNTGSGSVQWCLESAESVGCSHCVLVAWLLLQMSETQRRKIYATIHMLRRDIDAITFAEDTFCPCAHHMAQRRDNLVGH